MAQPTPDSLAEGEKVGAGRFMLVRLLGRGGMGAVWLARDSRFQDEEVVLRFLPTEIAENPAAVEELQREARKSRGLTHPNIVRIHDLYEPPGEPAFISMEYVDGPSLANLRLQQPEPHFAWDYLRPLAIQLCQALEYAHGEGVIHRDLKPSNLMLDGRGRLKIADFGIAASISDSVSRVSQGDATSGTPPYMSPQLMHGETPQPTDDVHAVGATLYELLSGHPTFASGDTAAIMRQVLDEPVPPLSPLLAEAGCEVPEPVVSTVMSCLAKDAAQRPQSAQAVLEQLLGLASVVAPALEEPKPELIPQPGRRVSRVMILAVATLILAAIAGFGVFYFTKQNRIAAPPANRFTNSLGQVFVPVPGTQVRFCIWDTRLQDYEKFVDETHRDISIGIASVKNNKWTEQGDTLRSPGFAQGPTSPVCGVSWEDAQDFCKWLTLKERKQGLLTESQRYRLPKDEEWSAAAGDDLYPWGSNWPPPSGAGNYADASAADENWSPGWGTIPGYQDGYARTSPVGSFHPNQFGLYDMGGNVWQWCDDWYRKELNPQALRESMPFMERDNGGKHSRVMRGGSWRIDSPSLLLTGCRYFNVPHYRSTDVGFRCVLANDGLPAAN